MADYDSISEIFHEDTREMTPPLDEWEIEVLERGLHEDLGDVGGRESFIANARVLVKEVGGKSWIGLTRLEG